MQILLPYEYSSIFNSYYAMKEIVKSLKWFQINEDNLLHETELKKMEEIFSDKLQKTKEELIADNSQQLKEQKWPNIATYSTNWNISIYL